MKNKGGHIEKSKYSYLLQNTLLLTLASFGSKFLSFFLVPLYTNVLSTAEYGMADIITTSSTLLVYVLTINIGSSVLRFGIDKNEKSDRVFLYGARIDGFACVILAFGLFLAYLLHLFNWEGYYYIFLWLIFVAETFETLANQFLRAIDKVQVMAVSSLLGTIVRLASNLLFLLVLKWGMFGYLLSLVIGPSLATAYALIHILPLKIEKVSHEYEKNLHSEMRKYAIPTMFGQLGWWINNSLDKYFVIWLKGAAVNGLYSISYKLPSIMSMVCNIFGQAWGISAIRDFDKEDKDGFFSNTYELFNFVLVFCCSGLILSNMLISKMLFAKEFFNAWKYAPVLILAMLFSGLSSFWGGIFNAVKKNEVIAWTTVSAGVINAIFNAALIPALGAMGAAIATLLSFYSMWGLRYLASKKYISCHNNILKHHIMYLLIVVQIIFGYQENHFYVGQILIIVFMVLLNRTVAKKIFNGALQKLNEYAR